MAVTASATILSGGTLKSKAQAVTATHSLGSPEVVTVVHNLGATPDFCTQQLRSVIIVGGAPITGSATGYGPVLAFRSANASQALFDGFSPPGIVTSNWQAIFDFYFSVEHTVIR